MHKNRVYSEYVFIKGYSLKEVGLHKKENNMKGDSGLEE